MPRKKDRLALLRTTLQNKLKAKAFIDEQVDPFLEILAYLRQSNVPFDIVDFIGADTEWLPYLEEEFRKPIYNSLSGIEWGKSQAADLLHQLFVCWPSTNTLRYVPPFDKIDIAESSVNGLKSAVENLDIENQTVCMYYLRYAPVMELQLYDLMSLDGEDLFNFWHGDVVIFPKDLSWLVVHTLEEEWHVGRIVQVK